MQPTITRPKAHELLIGVYEDRLFGPMILFGAGGTATEIIHDTAVALPPLDTELARDLMEQTRIFKLLEGYRDQPSAGAFGHRRSLGAAVAARGRLSGGEGARHQSLARRRDGGHRARRPHPHRPRRGGDAKAPIKRLAIRPYPNQWETWAGTDNGYRIFIRPIRPADEHLYRRVHRQASRRRISASAFSRRARSSLTSSSPASRRSTMRAPWLSWRWTRTRRSCSAWRGWRQIPTISTANMPSSCGAT